MNNPWRELKMVKRYWKASLASSIAKIANIQESPSRMNTPATPRNCWLNEAVSDLFSFLEDIPQIWRMTIANMIEFPMTTMATGAKKET